MRVTSEKLRILIMNELIAFANEYFPSNEMIIDNYNDKQELYKDLRYNLKREYRSSDIYHELIEELEALV